MIHNSNDDDNDTCTVYFWDTHAHTTTNWLNVWEWGRDRNVDHIQNKKEWCDALLVA